MASLLRIFFIKFFELCKLRARIEIEVVVVVVSAAVAVVNFLVFHPIVCQLISVFIVSLNTTVRTLYIRVSSAAWKRIQRWRLPPPG